MNLTVPVLAAPGNWERRPGAVLGDRQLRASLTRQQLTLECSTSSARGVFVQMAFVAPLRHPPG